MRRIKELDRGKVRRRLNPVVYLICEGSETEIRYFKRFRSRGCHIDIIPITSQYKAADKLVQKVKATMGNNPYIASIHNLGYCHTYSYWLGCQNACASSHPKGHLYVL